MIALRYILRKCFSKTVPDLIQFVIYYW